ncbi:unnamed protein product [marine sediment metagenome]|uniref:HTH cro/C1-type domain-containing protein n=1 Tax=marine sediment metagenome TaxID=412755 RepID=X1PF30_9ZZZZ
MIELENPLVEICRVRDINKAQLALLLGVTPSAISQYMLAQLRPSKRVRVRLAEIGVDVETFLTAFDAFREARRKAVARHARARSRQLFKAEAVSAKGEGE